MRLLILTSRFPYPINKGDKLRAYYQIIELAKTNEIHLISLNDKAVESNSFEIVKSYCKSINIFKLNRLRRLFNLSKTLLNNKPFQVNYFYSSRIQNKIDLLIDEIKPDHIYCQLVRTALYMKNQHQFTSTLDYMDALSLGIQRRIGISKSWMKPILKIEHERLIKFENLAYEFFDSHTIISKSDRNHIIHNNKENIAIIPNGIDRKWIKKKKYPKEYDLVFIGNLSYIPNIEAANYIIKKIVPLLVTTFPKLKVLIAGSSPSKKLMRQSNQYVDIKGWIEDIKEAYCKGKVFFAPMQIGTGLQNKLLEAMTLEIPCITSNLANKSLNATHNKNILIGNSIEEFIAHIKLCLENDNFREHLGKKGGEFVLNNFDWEKTNKKLLEIFNQNKMK